MPITEIHINETDQVEKKETETISEQNEWKKQGKRKKLGNMYM